MEIHAQLNILRRWLPLTLVAVLAAAALGFALSSIQAKQYESKATLIVGASLSGVNPDYNQLLVSQRLSSTYASIATTHDVMAEVIKELGLGDSPEALATRISVRTSPDTALLEVTARDGAADKAAAIANAVAKNLINVSPAVRGQEAELLDSIEADITAVRSEISATQAKIEELIGNDSRTPAEEATLQTLQSRIVSLRATYATLLSYTSSQASNLLTIVQPALAPDGPIPSRPQVNALLAATLAFLIVCAVVFVVEYLDDALKDPKQVSDTLGLPTLGSIERMRGGGDRRPFYRLVALLYPRSLTAEAYRTLRTNLEFAAVDKPVRSLLVASAVPREGKTVTSANLAIVVAQAGQRVLLVDLDLRSPGVTDLFNLPNVRGFTDLIRSPMMDPSTLVQTTEQQNLHILATGPLPPNPAELIASQRARDLLSALAATYDLVIVDSPPASLFADAPILSSYLDATLLVVESRRGRQAKVLHVLDGLQRAGATILGVVLNGTARNERPEYGYYYQAEAADSPVTIDPGIEGPPGAQRGARAELRRSNDNRVSTDSTSEPG